MPRRPDQFGFGVTIPATTARLVDLAAEIMGEPEPDEMAFLHSVLAQWVRNGLQRISTTSFPTKFFFLKSSCARPRSANRYDPASNGLMAPDNA